MPLLMNEDHTFLYDYKGALPQTITLSSYTTGMEQLRLSSDNLTNVMIKTILPQVIEPKIDVKEIYEPDYYLLLRHLRILTWGPFFTPRSFYCNDCKNEDGTTGKIQKSDKQVNLSDVPVIRPDKDEDLKTEVTISAEDFIFFEGSVKLHLNRCKDLLLLDRKMSEDKKGLLPIAASIQHVEGMDFIDISEAVDWLANLMPADFEVIRQAYRDAFNVGLGNRLEFECPICGGRAWVYVPVNDNYFRPTKEDLREWKRVLGRTKGKVRPGK